MDTIRHYASFPATGVSLRQMVQFGEKPSTGTLFRASQFLAEELPIRLAHRVQELDNLPDGLNNMPSVKKVQDWYAQSFEVRDDTPALCDSNRRRLADLTCKGNYHPSTTTASKRSTRKTHEAGERGEEYHIPVGHYA